MIPVGSVSVEGILGGRWEGTGIIWEQGRGSLARVIGYRRLRNDGK